MAEDQIKMGVTAGPHAEIMEQVKKLLEKDGVQMKVIEFTDYIQPNAALSAGDLDANSYQHQPYLDAQIKDRGYKFVSVGSTITFPMGVYSKKIKSLNDLKVRARGRAQRSDQRRPRLLVLQAKGVIKLKADAGLKATPLDIVENPKKIKIVELDAAQLPRSLDDFDAAVINGNYAESAGLSPTKDAIAVEASTGPYANVIAVRIRRQGQALGRQAGQGLPQPGSEEVRAGKVQGFRDHLLVIRHPACINEKASSSSWPFSLGKSRLAGDPQKT
jgi:D-methionine transport system substrate-binding protein